MLLTGFFVCLLSFTFVQTTNAVGLGAACTADAQCDSPATTDTKCQDSVCKLLVEEDCSSATDKCVKNAQCTSNVCACKTGYKAGSNKLCLAEFGTTCSATADCDQTVTSTVCDTFLAIPVCRIGNGGTCSGTGHGDKCVYGAACSTTCACGTGYTVVVATKLCQAAIGTQCEATAGCASSVCDVSAASPICAIGVGGTCTSSPTKCVTNAACTGTSNTLCECSAGYTVQTDKTCASGATWIVASLGVIVVALAAMQV